MGGKIRVAGGARQPRAYLSLRPAGRRGPRWGLFQRVLNGRQDAFDVVHDLAIPLPVLLTPVLVSVWIAQSIEWSEHARSMVDGDRVSTIIRRFEPGCGFKVNRGCRGGSENR